MDVPKDLLVVPSVQRPETFGVLFRTCNPAELFLHPLVCLVIHGVNCHNIEFYFWFVSQGLQSLLWLKRNAWCYVTLFFNAWIEKSNKINQLFENELFENV
jgi:hypothetical protein